MNKWIIDHPVDSHAQTGDVGFFVGIFSAASRIPIKDRMGFTGKVRHCARAHASERLQSVGGSGVRTLRSTRTCLEICLMTPETYPQQRTLYFSCICTCISITMFVCSRRTWRA
jgi:hypothetical protein